MSAIFKSTMLLGISNSTAEVQAHGQRSPIFAIEWLEMEGVVLEF